MIQLEKMLQAESIVPKNKVNILLVDDREDGLLALEAVLDDPHYNLVKASSGHEALGHIFQNDFAVILLDVQMPVMDGFDTARLIKQSERSKDTPILFLTAINKETKHIYEGYEAGAVDYLFKPFDPFVLKSKVAVFVDLYQKNMKLRQHARLIREIERNEREKRLAELELESLRRYISLADAIPHIIWKLQVDGTLDYCNQNWCSYTGLSLEQSKGRGWQTVLNPEDFSRFMKIWSEARETGNTFDAECRICRCEDKTYRWHLVRMVTEKRGTEIVSWIATCTDIHDRKIAQANMVKHAEDLMRSNQELERFAYVASHDLQEPLRMVTSYTQLLADRYRNRLDEDADDFIKYALEGAHRSQQLINDLLEYSRIRSSEKPFSKINLKEVLERAISNLKMRIEETRAVITQDDLPEIQGDYPQFVQLFQNLIGNAIKFRSKADPKIHIGSRLNGQGWVFSVQDNGIGIDPAYTERIFIIFQRLHTSDQYPGTGIGLAICKKIVENHGGRIWVESKAGEGAAFYFTVPNKELYPPPPFF